MKLFKETQQTGKLKTRKEIHPSNFREKDGILVHIAKNGRPVLEVMGFIALRLHRS